jgi:hypothetical protein
LLEYTPFVCTQSAWYGDTLYNMIHDTVYHTVYMLIHIYNKLNVKEYF